MNATRSAVSPGRDQVCSCGQSANVSRVISVQTMPGLIANTLTPKGRASRATASVQRTSAALLAMYAELIAGVSGSAPTG